MAITYATLAHEIDGKVEYIYPKTIASLVEYDSTQNVKEKIDSMVVDIEKCMDDKDKVDKPRNSNGDLYDGEQGQVLESNGDGSTSWVTRARVYVGTDEMPEGYDVQINPYGVVIEIDDSLTKEGAVAEAKAVGNAIKALENNSVPDTVVKHKVDKPIDENGNAHDGAPGQVLETNGDGTTSWVSRARVYVGSDEMPEGYDVQINPDCEVLEIDETLTKSGAIADAKAVGDAIKTLENNMNNIDDEYKLSKPLDSNNIAYDGAPGQVLETNGDGTTSWVTHPKVYFGSDTMPEGYDIKIDPNGEIVEIDRTLSKDGAVAEAKAVGDAIKSILETINTMQKNIEALQ